MTRPQSVFEAARASAPGDRGYNQDRSLFLGSTETLLLGVADGLGGHPRGEAAAQLLMDVCESQFRRATRPLADPQRFMLRCIGRAHVAILRFGRRQDPRITPRTTAVLAVIQHGAVHWAHVGDSRFYLIRAGRVHARTRDHAQVRFAGDPQTGDPARAHASLTRCLGGIAQPPITSCGPQTALQADDLIVLCSDGLWSQVPGQTLVRTLHDHSRPLGASLPALVKQAATLPNSDNVTAVAVRWLAGTGASPTPGHAPQQRHGAPTKINDPT